MGILQGQCLIHYWLHLMAVFITRGCHLDFVCLHSLLYVMGEALDAWDVCFFTQRDSKEEEEGKKCNTAAVLTAASKIICSQLCLGFMGAGHKWFSNVACRIDVIIILVTETFFFFFKIISPVQTHRKSHLQSSSVVIEITRVKNYL